MKKEDEEVTLTLNDLAVAMAAASSKQAGLSNGWALDNWRDFLPAAILVKEKFGIDPVVACDYCCTVYSHELSMCPNCGE